MLDRRRLVGGALAIGGLAMAGCSSNSGEVLEISVAPPVAAPEKYAAIVVDARTGASIYAVAASEIRFPASLTKMMTLYMLFEALQSGRATLSTRIPVSARAASRPPSKLYLKAGETIDVDTAIRALVVKSANDVATAVAEFLGGDEASFCSQMTSKARALGMRSTVFTNASGLPDRGMQTTARDMAVLGIALKRNFPQYFRYFSLTSFEHGGKVVDGHNRVLGMVSGANGIKTGYTRASGFNLVTSVDRDGRQIVAVVMGGKTARDRDEHMAQLVTAAMARRRR